ncbi:MAG TPA: hypothetical protein VIY29_16950 [Ktedonobacteraceae bacterium]
MDSRTTGRPDSHIRLRHSMRITVGEQAHTIEIEIPIPVGASADSREQLLNEAEVSLEELAQRIQHGAPRKPSRSQPPQPARAPSAKQPVPLAQAAANKPSTTTAPTVSSTANSLLVPVHPPDSVPTAPPEAKEEVVPPTRPNIGASMPSSPGMSLDTSGSLKLPQFIQFIKESLGLTPKQAMDLLNVKSLSGLNLRDALDELQQIVGQEATNIAVPTSPANLNLVEHSQAHPPHPLSSSSSSAAQPRPFPSAANPKNPDIIEITHAVIHDNPPAYAFDEEIDLEQEFALPEDDDVEYVPELTSQERELAEEILIKLRDARGSSLASEARLKVLHNVTDSQVSEEQLLQLVQGVWGSPSLKKLKNDQLEALIYWAKADNFDSEVDLVLLLIQEEQYARSDR